MVYIEDIISHLSTKPWSDYTESDYTPQQWYDACLIHLSSDPKDKLVKSNSKLPVKTPNGAVNENGVYAAAAALAGARAELQAPADAKMSAAKQLIKMYQSMNKKPPESLMGMMHTHDIMSDFLAHFGDYSFSSPDSEKTSEVVPNWNDVSNRLVMRINNISNNPLYSGANLNKNAELQKQYDAVVGKAVNDCLVSMAVLPLNKVDNNAFLYSFDRSNQRLVKTPVLIAHQNDAYECPEFSVNMDENGFIVGIKAIKPKGADGVMWQSSMTPSKMVESFIEHHGVKGQKWGIRRRRKIAKVGPSKDSKRTTTSLKKGKRSGVGALTNKELKDLTNRMELERKFHQGLPKNVVEKGHDKVKAYLAVATTIGTVLTFSQTPAGKKIASMLNRHGPKQLKFKY